MRFIKKIGGFVLVIAWYAGNTFVEILQRLIHVLGYYGRRMALSKFKLDYQARENDIFIVTYPKSGTTWVQNILYQLTSDGSMSFSHISQIIPHLEEDTGCIPVYSRMPSPRILKSHLPYGDVPKGKGKYIYVVRNGMDVAVSYFHHYRHYRGFRGDFDQFFEMFMEGKVLWGSWFKNVADWSENKQNLNLLLLRYEDLKRDLEGSIRKISNFCDLPVEETAIPGIVERCGFDFMKKHELKFDLAMGNLVRNGHMLKQFLRKGEMDQWKEELGEEQKYRYAVEFTKTLGDSALKGYLPSDHPKAAA